MLKRYLDSIKIFLLAGCLIFLYAFTNERNSKRQVAKTDIIFREQSPLFITNLEVNKLLVQSNRKVTDMRREKVVLNRLEKALNAHPMIREAQVYFSVPGVCKVSIEQRRPIARVVADEAYYIDANGNPMPLSPHFSARVPLVSGEMDKKGLEDCYKLANYIDRDSFLKMYVTAIYRKAGSLMIQTRTDLFLVKIGDSGNLDKKFKKFKAFYQKASKDSLLDTYSLVNLEFKNQVVCTKK